MQGSTLLLAGGLSPSIWTRARTRETLKIALVAPSGDARAASVGRGVMLGVEEAARTGELMDRAIELLPGSGDADRLVREERVAALIGACGDDSAREMGRLADAAGVLFVNAGSRSDALRGAECRRNVFHVEASEAMYAAALSARREGSGDGMGAAHAAPRDGSADAPAGHAEGSADATAVLWHPSLERFGAAQLNDRFRARFGGEMDGAAWAGWMAVKALWEASLRARSIDPMALRAYLERGATQLDGHKGWPLSFRAWDRQLRQPLYLVAGSAGGGTRVVAEVPERRGEEGSSRDLLDRLGADASAMRCATRGEGTR
jgi:ABC-type branched-subunit amino acid transport system substrate-binding protein